MKTKLTLFAILGAALLMSANAPAVSLSFVPASASVELGSPVSIEVRVSGLGEGIAPSLGGYDLTFGFDPSLLWLDSFSFGDTILGSQLDLGVSGSITAVDSSVAGQLNVFELSLESTEGLNILQAAEFALGTIVFDTVGVGLSGVEVLSSVFSDAEGGELSVEAGRGSVQIVQTVNPVPDAGSSGVLLALSFTGLLACSRLPQRRPGRGSARRRSGV